MVSIVFDVEIADGSVLPVGLGNRILECQIVLGFNLLTDWTYWSSRDVEPEFVSNHVDFEFLAGGVFLSCGVLNPAYKAKGTAGIASVFSIDYDSVFDDFAAELLDVNIGDGAVYLNFELAVLDEEAKFSVTFDFERLFFSHAIEPFLTQAEFVEFNGECLVLSVHSNAHIGFDLCV